MTLLSIIVIGTLGFLTLVGLGILLAPLLKKWSFRRNYVKIFGKFVYHIALYKDYLLINKLHLPLDNERKLHLDHVLFGEKYIYAIKDKYYSGAISGKENDESWLYFPDNSKKSIYIDNPLKINRQRIQKLALFTGLDDDLFVSIILVNNDCLLDKFESQSRRDYIIPVNKLEKLVAAIESRSVPKINQEQLEQAVQDLNKKNKGIEVES